jgi:hypothetical protein
VTLDELAAQMAEVDQEIAALNEQLESPRARKARIQAIIAGPRVLPVAHYYRHLHEHEEVCATIEEAFKFLDYGEDYGDLSAAGVTVGGAPIERPDNRED